MSDEPTIVARIEEWLARRDHPSDHPATLPDCDIVECPRPALLVLDPRGRGARRFCAQHASSTLWNWAEGGPVDVVVDRTRAA